MSGSVYDFVQFLEDCVGRRAEADPPSLLSEFTCLIHVTNTRPVQVDLTISTNIEHRDSIIRA